MVLLESTLLVHVEKEKSLVNQRLTRGLRYPDPGSNRDGLLHWCLRPARLPIPPSGLSECKGTYIFLMSKEFGEKLAVHAFVCLFVKARE